MKTYKFYFLLSVLFISCGLSAQTIYVTKTGKKYHKANCQHLKYSKKELKLKKARTLGYLACKVCKPKQVRQKTHAEVTPLTLNKDHKTHSTKKVNASQCTGKIQSGRRCKRKTKNANGRCYQH